MGKTVLVTGAAGFIGFHLSQALLELGDTVIACDNFNDYYDPQLKEARAALLKEQGVDVLRMDVCDLALRELIQKQGVTHIAHLAAQAGVRYSLTNPDAYIHSNIQGFLNILEASKENPAMKVVYASSSSVYGLNTQVPFSVDDRCDAQASLYGATKKSNELMARSYHHLYKFSVTGLRYFTVYGPWGRPDMAYYDFTRRILNDEPLQLFNNGKMRRDFTYIDDIVAGTLAALDRCDGYHIYNLGNNEPVTLMDFVACIETALGKKVDHQFLPMQKGDVVETYADISASQRDLDWSPTTRLDEGIPRFVDWYLYHCSDAKV